MILDIDRARAAGLDLEAMEQAAGFFVGLREPGPEGEAWRLSCLRALADLARENAAARSIVGELLDAVAGELPGEADTFRAHYLDGDTKPSARQISRCLYMDRATVFNHTRRIFAAMLPLAFGPEFAEKPKPPKAKPPAPKRPRKRPPQHRRAFFALLDDVSRMVYTYGAVWETAQEAPGGRQETPPGTGEG